MPASFGRNSTDSPLRSFSMCGVAHDMPAIYTSRDAWHDACEKSETCSTPRCVAGRAAPPEAVLTEQKKTAPAIAGWFAEDANGAHLLGTRCVACGTYFFP